MTEEEERVLRGAERRQAYTGSENVVYESEELIIYAFFNFKPV